ncbi:MAG TPA: hypothetical protein VEC57_03520 [Candidatus Limnocylindrales bacterium]|nr:hypothetical protein [Candidatus Limnocylindrales bacterium]
MDADPRTLWQRARFEVRVALDRVPGIFAAQMALRGHRELVAGPGTDIVIEGFPRSANTYAVAAFAYAQPSPPRIARHLHAPAQLALAHRYGLPALLLIRPVPDPVLSVVIREQYLTVERALRWYVEFHEALLPLRSAFVVATFDDVLHRFGSVIDGVNARFGTTFARYEATAQAEAIVQKRVEQMEREDSGSSEIRERAVARPSRFRSRLKEELTAAYQAPDLASLREAAARVYTQLAR